MSKESLSPTMRYGLAVGSVAAAAAVTQLVYAAAVPLPFAFFYAAVALASYYCGGRAGLLSILLSALVADYFFLEPRFAFSRGRDDLLRLGVFVFVALLVWYLTEKRRRADEQLLRRERELTDFLENATIGLHWVGPDGTIQWANRAELELLGYAPEEYIGHNIAEFHADAEVIEDILARLSRGEELHGYEARLRRKDGSIRHVQISSNVLREDGRFVHTRCFTRDVTESLRADEARAHLAAIVESSDDAVVSKTLDSIITSWNKGAERVFGYTAEEVIGKPVTILIPEDHPDEEPSIIRRLRAGERIEHYETVRRRKDGTLIDVSLTVSPVRDSRGRIIGASKIARDISATKRAESERKRAEDATRFQAQLLDTVEQAVIATDNAGAITYWNSFAEKLYGWKADEVLGRPVVDVTPSDVSKEQAAEIMRRVAAGESWTGEFEVRRRDGTTFLASVSNTPIYDAEGRMVGVVGVSVDITGRVRAERSLREQSEVIEQAYDAVFLRDSSNAITLWNSGAERTYGYTKEDALGRSPHELLQTVTPIPLAEIYEKLRGEGYWEGELTHTRKDGERIIVESRWATVRDRRGEATSILEITRDVTARKRAEEELREQAEIIETVNSVGLTLAGELDLHKLVQAVTDAATEISNAQFGSFFYNVLDESGESYMLYTLSGVPRSAFAHFPMPRNTDIFAPTFKGEGTVLIADVTKDPRYGKNSPYYGMPEGHLPVTSYLAVPVVSRSGEVYGGLFFGHPEVGVFTERAARIVEGLAAQAAIAMDNARLFDAVRRERASAEASEERYRFLAESIPQIVWTADAEGRSDYFNQRWYEYTGLPREAEGAMPAHAVVHPDDVETVLEGWRHASETGESYDIELRLRRGSDGSYRWHLARSVPLRDGEGRIVKWFGTSTDIDDRKRAEDAQRFLSEASEVLVSSLDYEATLRRIADLVVPRLADWCAVDMLTDERTLRRLAVSHQDPAKIELAEEMERRYPQSITDREGVAKVIRTGEPELYPNVPEELLALVARDAEQLRMLRELGLRSAMVVPLKVQGHTLGAITFVSAESGRHYTESDLAFAEDLAHRAALAVENARLYREAQDVNRLKDEFLATLSHELRTPLTAVLGWTRLLGTRQLDEATQARALETIERNAQAQVQLIDDILDVSRIIRGKLRLNVRPVDLATVIDAAVDSARPGAEAKGVRLQVVLDRAAGPISGDPDRLQQVIWNLLSNAVKFTPRAGRVQVVLSRVNSHVEVAIIDTGQGIEPEFLPYVFDRFRQADPTTTRQHGGLGLGLAIVRHLVELHGGSVRVESAGAGKGSTFRVMLPLLAALRETPPADEARADAENGARGDATFGDLICPTELDGLRVLVVEDDADSRELLLTVLSRCHADVTVAASVAEAMDALERRLPDVVISDIEMPGEDGFAFIRRLRQLPADRGGDIPAAALTAYARPEDRMRALIAGFQIHVPKPVEPAELVTVVASLAGRAIKS